MKHLIILIALALPLVLAALHVRAQDNDKQAKRTLYHVVSFKFKPTATPQQIKAVETSFVELKNKIPTITSLHWGTNVSPEKHDKGFTHCFVLTFASEKDRDDYLPHPAH